MTEMIIPGTYINVRAEGLISAGRIATGIVGVIGTAKRGVLNQPVTLAGMAEATDLFGAPDDFAIPEDGANPLTLTRSLEQIYANGASTVIAVRVASSSASSATYAVLDAAGQGIAVLSANQPGSWGNEIKVEIAPANEECRISNEAHDTSFSSLDYGRVVPSSENRLRIYRGITRRSTSLDIVYAPINEDEEVVGVGGPPATYQLSQTPVQAVDDVNLIRVVDATGATVTEYGSGDILYNSSSPPAAAEVNINTTTGALTFGTAPAAATQVIATYASGHAPPTAGQVLITTWSGALAFATGEAPQSADGDELIASYLIDRDVCSTFTISHEGAIERHTVPDGNLLAARLNIESALVSAVADGTNGDAVPAQNVTAYLGTGSNVPGSNGADAGKEEYQVGLQAIENMLVNIVHLAGQDAKQMASTLEGHLNVTKETGYERIGVIGAPGADLASYLGHTVASDRMIVVAPGLRFPDGAKLPTAYAAAAVAGLISSLPVHTSLTNKAVTVPGLDFDFNRGQQVQLIKRDVLSLIVKGGHRVLKGLSTEGEGQPFSSIPIRRIVDYAKYGVRSAADPYIGRLNNARVRAALQATLEGFLTRMVEDEQLTAFEMSVSATRAQEIAGEVNVVMALQPTFSIDFVKVTMNLK